MITLNVQNKQLFDKILWFLNRFKNDGLNIMTNKDNLSDESANRSKKSIDFSSFRVDSFKNIDGLEYQKKIRDEW